MLRNKWSMVFLVLAPVLVSAILSSAFTMVLQSYESSEMFSVGYSMESGSFTDEYIDTIKESGSEAGITFYEFHDGDPREIISNNDLAGFVVFSADEYVIYRVADRQTEGMTLEYFLGRIMLENMNAVLSAADVQPAQEISLPKTKLDFMPAINSTDYYGIIYIVLLGCIGMVCTTGMLSSEKKYGIGRRYQISGLTGIQLYLGKLIPAVLVQSVGIALASVISTLVLGIHWGRPLLSAVILFTMITAVTAFGFMLYSITDNIVAMVITLFLAVFMMGFVGGSFENYMYSSVPEHLKQISPVYHVNRALVELSCMNRSNYALSAIVFALVIFVICSLIAVASDDIRRKVNA